MNDTTQSAKNYCDRNSKFMFPIIMDLMRSLFNMANGDDPGDIYADLERKLPNEIYKLLEHISEP